MEINEKLLRQIIEDVLSEMQTSDTPVSFHALQQPPLHKPLHLAENVF
ncbi:propanediol dehydratase medium subunit [Salmonella enterica subsp. diarizonae]|uniref:Propanediol dehydratase medium subunit n=1 Tax=Salmonella diarizonae TaxID=59204 RepID=A0A379TWU7_SALDZ|nr:propanediol dehydratase medium subunit [Salmonella enterica subsp. diarizonae]